MNKVVQFLNRSKDEEFEISYGDLYGYSISLSNYCGDSCYISKLSIADLVNMKLAIEEAIINEKNWLCLR